MARSFRAGQAIFPQEFASAGKGPHGFSRVKTASGVVILVDGRQPRPKGTGLGRPDGMMSGQPIFLVCRASRRLSTAKNSEGLAGRSGTSSARQRTQAGRRLSRTITRQTAVQSGPQACVPLSPDACVCKGKRRSTARKGPPSGCVGSFRLHPTIIILSNFSANVR